MARRSRTATPAQRARKPQAQPAEQPALEEAAAATVEESARPATSDRQELIGGPRGGQLVGVAAHVDEIRLGAGGVYRRRPDGNFEWVSPA